MKLTQEEKRIKLAEAEGWEVIEFTICRVRPDKNGDPELAPIAPLPDYFNDLNAVRELQTNLTNDQRFEFVYNLNEVLGLVPLNSPASYKEVVLFAFADASAAQRAEALGKTLNLWTE